MVIRNLTTDKIEVEEVSLDGTAVTVTDANIVAGGQGTFGGTGVTCTPAGSQYSKSVVITYTITNGLSDAKQTGSKPLVGTCS